MYESYESRYRSPRKLLYLFRVGPNGQSLALINCAILQHAGISVMMMMSANVILVILILDMYDCSTIENRVHKRHQSNFTRAIANIAIKSSVIVVFKAPTLPGNSLCVALSFIDDIVYWRIQTLS